MFSSRFPRSSPGNFGGYHGNRWIPGTTLLLPAEPPPPSPLPSLLSSCPHVHRGERAETFQPVWTVSIWLLEKCFAASLTLTNPQTVCFFPPPKVSFNLLLTPKKLIGSTKLVLTSVCNQKTRWQSCVGPLTIIKVSYCQFKAIMARKLGLWCSHSVKTDKNCLLEVRDLR